MINTSNRNHVSISRIKEVQLEHESFFFVCFGILRKFIDQIKYYVSNKSTFSFKMQEILIH